MSKQVKIGIYLMIFAAVAFWGLNQLPFWQDVTIEVPAEVYKDNVNIEETYVKIKGRKTRYLFQKEDRFEGRLEIPALGITMESETRIYSSVFHKNIYTVQSTNFNPEMRTEWIFVLADEMMEEFSFVGHDGTFVSSSKEIYDVFSPHVNFHGGGMGFENLENIEFSSY
ncbi:hypothetical protein [Proteiniclasticum ruminis]|uniref:Uncharacterized protein n=1 Tax=Proteiniclasticum ruminis TaxID=398199 RepID=A0A1I4Z3D3_9CLOT|nr:hypothetical protein [Proteiniclasticum ruminis]SFN44762.1 hypothetical protein SAMN04488695_101921 [Proteiniclasticum ruminis]